MTLNDAYIYMDLLLDKANQPYFITEEKDKYLKLAIAEFIKTSYLSIGIDEKSSIAMAPFIDWNSWEISKADIIAGGYATSGYSAFSNKYKKNGRFSNAGVLVAGSANTTNLNTNHGYFKYGTQYQLPEACLYTLNVNVRYYNKSEIINPSTGAAWGHITTADVIDSPVIQMKAVNTKEFYAYSQDPFT